MAATLDPQLAAQGVLWFSPAEAAVARVRVAVLVERHEAFRAVTLRDGTRAIGTEALPHRRCRSPAGAIDTGPAKCAIRCEHHGSTEGTCSPCCN